MKCMSYKLKDFFTRLQGFSCLTTNQLELVVQSHRAFVASYNSDYHQEKLARIINGETVTDSESDDDDFSVMDVSKQKLSIQRSSKMSKKAAGRK